MTDSNHVIFISVFSGLLGAIGAQLLTGMFAYFNDKRKATIELRKSYRDRQLETAENFYYVTGETMAVLKKNIEYWKDRKLSRGDASISFFNKEMKKLDTHLEKLNSDNWKHSLISLYFNITLSYNELINANNKSHLLYLSLLDIADQIKANKGNNEDLTGEYYIGIFDLCSQYEDIYAMLAKDMDSVKTELLRTFQVK